MKKLFFTILCFIFLCGTVQAQMLQGIVGGGAMVAALTCQNQITQTSEYQSTSVGAYASQGILADDVGGKTVCNVTVKYYGGSWNHSISKIQFRQNRDCTGTQWGSDSNSIDFFNDPADQTGVYTFTTNPAIPASTAPYLCFVLGGGTPRPYRSGVAVYAGADLYVDGADTYQTMVFTLDIMK